jgi:hypothetical protein
MKEHAMHDTNAPQGPATAMRELRATMQGRVVSRGDDDYARMRQVFNGAVENQPALFAVCERSAACGAHVNTGCPYRCAAVDMT